MLESIATFEEHWLSVYLEVELSALCLVILVDVILYQFDLAKTKVDGFLDEGCNKSVFVQCQGPSD